MNRLLNVLFYLVIVALCFIGTYRSLVSGTLRLRFGDVRRAETPLIYWTLLFVFVALGLLALLMLTGLFDRVIGRI